MCKVGTQADAGLLELADEAGCPAGVMSKLAAHHSPGTLHRAFSVFLFDAEGRMLLQRVAAGKYRSPGVWSNSCCSHPLPQEDLVAAAKRRGVAELGVPAENLAQAGAEHGYNHTFVGRLLASPRPDPAEVTGTRLVNANELRRMLAREQFSVWFQAEVAMTAGSTGRPDPGGRSWPLTVTGLHTGAGPETTGYPA